MKNKLPLPALILIYTITLLGLVIVTIGINRGVTAMVENAPLENRNCVIIDAGHGGMDGGATSCTGILESTINLEIALRLEDLFHLLGVNTVMIRDTDRSVYTNGETIAQKKISDLKQRVKIVNETTGGLLISIHQNYFSDGKYYGPQVFYNRVGESENLASSMQTALVTMLCPESHRKKKVSEGIYLMDRIQVPGLLIECGFLSNPQEEKKLRDASYQKKLCSIIASVCSTYFQNTVNA